MIKNRNRYILVALVLVVVLIIFSASIFFSNNDTTVPTDKVVTPNEPTTIPKASNNTVSIKNKVGVKIYQANNYSVRYPDTWTVDASDASVDQNNFLALQPENSSNDSSHIAVEINDASTTSLDKMSAGLSLLGFTKQNAVVAGVQAQKFSGAIVLSQKSLHNTAYLFEHNNSIYLIKLSYEGDYNPQLEEEFTNFIDTFTLN